MCGVCKDDRLISVFTYTVVFLTVGRYGIVLKKLDLLKEAVTVLTESVHKAPLHWGAWLELSLLITDKDTVSRLSTRTPSVVLVQGHGQ